MPKYITCPSCDGEGGRAIHSADTSYISGTVLDNFHPCVVCDGEGKIEDVDNDSSLPPHYKEEDEFDASKEQDIKDSLREEGF